MYSEVEDLEAQLSNTSLSKMVILNYLKRVALLKKDLMEEAEKVSKENYGKQKAKKKMSVNLVVQQVVFCLQLMLKMIGTKC